MVWGVFFKCLKKKSNASLTGVEIGEESTSTTLFPRMISWSVQMKMASQSTQENSCIKSVLALSYIPSWIWNSLLPLIIFKAM